jgi:putative hydrolase of the HAD superfamily
VFFDAVGTLLLPDPPAPVVYADAARRRGLTLSPEEVRTRFVAAYRREEEADATTGWVTSEDRERRRWHRIVTDALAGVPDPDDCFRELFDHFARPTAWRLAPDAAEVLPALQARGLVLGLGSNYDARLLSVLDGFGELAPLRECVVISAAVGVRKPGSAFFGEVVRAAGCAPAEVLFVGDDLENDYRGAAAAGLCAVLLDPYTKHEVAAHRIGRLADLLW